MFLTVWRARGSRRGGIALGHLVPLGNVDRCAPVGKLRYNRLVQHANKNFVIAFPIGDIILGTFYHPAPDEVPPTGVDIAAVDRPRL
jgi:hypothetical protein